MQGKETVGETLVETLKKTLTDEESQKACSEAASIMGRLGGPARARKLSRRRRIAISRLGVKARQLKRRLQRNIKKTLDVK